MSTAQVSFGQKVKEYLSLIKFSHTVFALPFALIGFTLAVVYYNEPFEWHLFIKMLFCMVFARTAAMAFNRYLDRKFDALNPRTAQREIPAGIIKPEHALLFTIINSALFILTTLLINDTVFYLSIVALFVILFYSYTKRITALCHIVLGIGLSLSPLGAFLAVTGYFAWLPVLFSFAVLTWVAGFDIIYALQDEQFDRSQKLHSIPAALGVSKALMVSNLLHASSAMFIIAAGLKGDFGILYWVGTAFYIGLLIYQHMLVKPNDLSKVNMAFANTNGIASIVFAFFTILSLILH
ncbi:UbiA-like polyprenyltransferase [Polluticoccus soli]|uniref:UbiA-like polyprenyltransferase n=1 Tax=Polluticoccus soli TaxID=3034150 RepID=UPI0023E1DB00|nr:UbiA-like polyprenyltransferase [Flavipsychrobacter sp. JY13-12]